MAEKISKSKDPKYAWERAGIRAELEPDEKEGFFLSVENSDGEGWNVVDVTLEQLREMLAFAERYEAQRKTVSSSDAPAS
jgi:hypothetical protein